MQENKKMDWRIELNGLLGERKRLTRAEQENAVFQAFLSRVVMPAFSQISEELTKYGRECVVRETSAAANLTVRNGMEEEMSFRVLRRALPSSVVPYAEIRAKERRGLRIRKTESLFRSGEEPHTLEDVTTDDVIALFMKFYGANK